MEAARPNRSLVATSCCITSGMSPKRRANLYLEPQQWTILEAISEETGAPVSELIRRAINEYILEHGTRAHVQTLKDATRKMKKGAEKD